MALKQTLALFDFDNTLSLCDSFLPFILYVGGPGKFLTGLSLLAKRRLSGPVDRREAKEILSKASLGGIRLEKLSRYFESFYLIFSSSCLNKSQLAELNKHKECGDRVIIVSASPRLYLETFAKNLAVELIATELVISDGLITGEVSGNNCRGPEKVRRISEILNLGDYSVISAYGDSDGDTEMLKISTNPVYRGGRGSFYTLDKIISCLVLYCRCLFSN